MVLLKISFTKEIHVVTYQGRIEAVSYAENAEMQVPKIEIIAANHGIS
jgi:hypothetical protein